MRNTERKSTRSWSWGSILLVFQLSLPFCRYLRLSVFSRTESEIQVISNEKNRESFKPRKNQQLWCKKKRKTWNQTALNSWFVLSNSLVISGLCLGLWLWWIFLKPLPVAEKLPTCLFKFRQAFALFQKRHFICCSHLLQIITKALRYRIQTLKLVNQHCSDLRDLGLTVFILLNGFRH